MRVRLFWTVLLLLTGVLALLYLYFTLFPGVVDPAVGKYFSPEEISAGREYARVRRLLYIASFVIQALILTWLVFSPAGDRLGRAITRLTGDSYLVSTVLFFLALWLLLRLVMLPFSLYSSYYLEHLWGFSTQSLVGWWSDYLKSAALDVMLSGLGVVLLFWALGRWPRSWWFAAGSFLGVWLVIANYLWPVVVAPLFNRFEPVTDPAVVAMVERLAEKADLEIDQVLVMDASARTTKANAYFSGLGNTKRIVLYDTLLQNYPPDEVETVVAHEMAHWKLGHIARGTLYGILANFVLWFILFLVLRSSLGFSRGSYPPHTWAVLMLFFLLIGFVTNPIVNGFSRIMEREADAMAFEITSDYTSHVRLQVNLAKRDLADVSPPAFIEWFAYTHPSTMHRIRAFEELGKMKSKAGSLPGA
ncbi:MAG: M48 family metallopeptidase [bacterium]